MAEEKQPKEEANEVDGGVPEDSAAGGTLSGSSAEGPKVENNEQPKDHANEADGGVPEDGVPTVTLCGFGTEDPEVKNHEGYNHGEYFYGTHYPASYVPQLVPYYMQPVCQSYIDFSGYVLPDFMGYHAQPYYYEPQPHQFNHPLHTNVDGHQGKSRCKKKGRISKLSKHEASAGEENLCGDIGRAVAFVLGENNEATLFSIAGRLNNIFSSERFSYI